VYPINLFTVDADILYGRLVLKVFGHFHLSVILMHESIHTLLHVDHKPCTDLLDSLYGSPSVICILLLYLNIINFKECCCKFFVLWSPLWGTTPGVKFKEPTWFPHLVPCLFYFKGLNIYNINYLCLYCICNCSS
jgi:hypothetical protein